MLSLPLMRWEALILETVILCFWGINYYLYGMAGNHIRTALFTLSWFILDARMLKDGYNMKSYDQINKRGFTIAELLIIVAIVGFLVAVSIPIFTAQLEKTRETVDIHTMRTAASLGNSDNHSMTLYSLRGRGFIKLEYRI